MLKKIDIYKCFYIEINLILKQFFKYLTKFVNIFKKL